MAAAEARAVWQRSANRHSVQDDSKRAPQSSSSATKQFVSGANIPSDGPNHPVKGSMPLSTRWWAQMQPNYRYQAVSTQKQALDFEIETSKPESNGDMARKSDSISTDDRNEGDSSFLVEKQEVNPFYGQAQQDLIDVLGIKEGYESINLDAFDCKKPVTKHSNEFGVDLDSPWTRIETTVPWWRTSDIDEIADLVSQNTQECIQNCGKYVDMAGPLVSSFDVKSHATAVCAQDCVDSKEVSAGNLGTGSHKSFSCSSEKDDTEATQFPEGDTSRAELLEALRHSQTRAREAEKAARQALAEKEHIVELFCKQASQLLAYKQWLRLLQFEQSFHSRSKKNSEMQSRRRMAKHRRPGRDIGKCSVAFALGLSLVGAGLVLGWTVGWMFPPF